MIQRFDDGSMENFLPAHILVADDEENTRMALIRAFQMMGYETEGAANGREVLNKLELKSFDVLLLDLSMPDLDGEYVLNYIRQHNLSVAVIVLTAYATLDSAISAIKAGAADYLLKPQRMADINLAIQRLLKRTVESRQQKRLFQIIQKSFQELESNIIPEQAQPDPDVTRAHFVLESDKRQIILKTNQENVSRIIELTKDQFAIMAFMIRFPRKVLSNREIAISALGYHNITEKEAESIVRPHILRLRRKLEADPQKPRIIRTLRGTGYFFDPPESS